MARLTRTSLLLSVTAVVASGAPPLAAQRVDATTTRRGARVPPGDGQDQMLRRLERQADSLAHLYNESDELSASERRRVGDALDQTVEQIDALAAARMSHPVEVHVRALRGTSASAVAPMLGEGAMTSMRRALTRGSVPRGWLGVLVSGPAREPWIANGEMLIRYLTYPVILSVEPSSPAERAGLRASDTLVAYDGHDVRDSDISLTRLLRPNTRVLVRIRRDGRTRDVPVTVADVPQRIRLRADMGVDLRALRGMALPQVPAFPRVPAAPGAPARAAAAALRAVAAPPMAALPPLPPMVGVGVNGVAGAQLAAVTEGLGRTLGVRQGVLVTNAPVGSPAYESGLQDGDVITRVAGRAVRTVGDVRELLAAAVDDGDHAVNVEVVRGRRTRTLVLRWDDGR